MKMHLTSKINQRAKGSSDAPNAACYLGSFPIRHNTVTAEVLARLLNGENLTGMDAVFSASTTRLAAVVHHLEENQGWSVDRVDVDVGTNDGRATVVRVYYLNRQTIRRAFDAGAFKFCASVKAARAIARKQAPKAKQEAAKRNATRSFNPNQGVFFWGEQ